MRPATLINQESAKQNLYDLLDLYEQHTGKGCEIGLQFIEDIRADRVDPWTYCDVDGGNCGCFHHSALIVLGKVGEFLELEYDNYEQNHWEIVNEIVGVKVADPNQPLEGWLLDNMDVNKPDQDVNWARETLIEWVEGWLSQWS